MIAIGSDHGGYKLKEEIKKYLEEKELEYTDCGTFDEERAEYPEIARALALEVQNGQAEKGIIICRSGIGMSMVANKFKGIRAANLHDEEEARFAKSDDDINVIALGGDYIAVSKAIRITRIWLGTEFKGGRYQERLEMVEEIEKQNMK